MTQQHTSPAEASKAPAAASTAVVGPLTMRDLVVLGAVAIIFIASLVPMIVTMSGNFNLWNISGLFYLTIGVILPLAVGGLFLARRLSPEVKVRLGSLSVDQFASVVAAFATFFFFVGTVTSFSAAYLIGLIGSLVLLVATVCAQWIPVFAADFAGRAEVPAHRAARDAVPASKRPAQPKPVQPKPVTAQGNAAQAGAGQGNGGQFVPAQYAPGQAAAQNAPAAQNAQGAWAGPQTASAHTPAGQIFTPAKAVVPGAAATGASTTTGKDQAAQDRPAASDQNVAATPVAHGATAPAAESTATSKQAATSSTSAAGATTNGAANAVEAVSEGGATQEAATTLNPQVAEPAVERTQSANRESIAATVNPAPAAVVAEPFWFAVDRPQNVIDEKTRQFVFKLMPGAWILALEDRGTSFLVQDSHGKTGVLLDLVGIERASDSQ